MWRRSSFAIRAGPVNGPWQAGGGSEVMHSYRPRLVLVRHAQASLGTADYDRLSPLGRRQARSLAQSGIVEADAVVVSGSHRRHRQTVDALVDRCDEVGIDQDLDEYDVGALVRAARRAPGFGAHLPDPAAAQGPRELLDAFITHFPSILEAWQRGRLNPSPAESWETFRLRAERAASRLTELAIARGCVIAVSSAGLISLALSHLLGQDLAWQRGLNVRMYNSAVNSLVLEPSGWRIERINCVRHLADTSWHTLA